MTIVPQRTTRSSPTRLCNRDAPKVIAALAKTFGDDDPPTAEAPLRKARHGARSRRDDGKTERRFPGAVPSDAKLVGLFGTIRTTNDDAAVDRVLAEVKAHIKDNADLTKQAADGWMSIALWRPLRNSARAQGGQEFPINQDAMSFGRVAFPRFAVARSSASRGCRAPRFSTRILPILTKAGCTGARHGAAADRGIETQPRLRHRERSPSRELGAGVDLTAAAKSFCAREKANSITKADAASNATDAQRAARLIADGAPFP
jgi:hypothetical protein